MYAHVTQLAEVTHSECVQCRCKSCRGYHSLPKQGPRGPTSRGIALKPRELRVQILPRAFFLRTAYPNRHRLETVHCQTGAFQASERRGYRVGRFPLIIYSNGDYGVTVAYLTVTERVPAQVRIVSPISSQLYPTYYHHHYELRRPSQC